MSEFIEYRLRALSEWLLKKSLSDEYCETNLLKTAISVEDAVNTLNMSKRVPRVIKSIVWEMSEDPTYSFIMSGANFEFDKKDIEDISDIYRDEILKSVESADLEPGDKAQSIQWLTSLGSKDKVFARELLSTALAKLNLTKGSQLIYLSTYLDHKIKSYTAEEGVNDEGWGDGIVEDEYYEEDYLYSEGISYDSAIIQNKLEKFFNWKKFMSIRDLMSIKSLEQFFKVVEDADEAIEEYNKNKEYLDADAGTEILGESGAWIAYIVKNKGAACKLGAGTDWCTAAPGTNWFGTYYHEKDPLFILEHKRDENERFQIHFGTMQFKDPNDEEVSSIDRANINDILNKFGSNKFLSSQLYSAYLKALYRKQHGYIDSDDFNKEDKRYIPDLYAKTAHYINEVSEDKIEEGNLPDSYSLPGLILEAVVAQIGSLAGDDDEVSDLTAEFLANYDPNGFFDVGGLDVDYPDLARSIVTRVINEEPSNAWVKKVMPFNLYDKFISGELLESGPVESLLKDDEEARKKIADMTAKNNGLRMLLGTEEVAPGAQKIIDEFYPNLYNSIVETMHVAETTDKNHPVSIRAGSTNRDVALDNLISSGFHLRFEEKFNDILEDIVAILNKQVELPSGAWWLNSILDAMSRANIVEKYWKHYLELLKFGLKVDFDRFSKYNDVGAAGSAMHNLSDDMRADIRWLVSLEETAYTDSLVSGTDQVIPGWRDQEVDGETLYEIFSVIEEPVSPLKDSLSKKYKPVIEFYHKILSILKKKFYENSSVGLHSMQHGSKTKVEIPREFLLYIATLFPSLWSTYNLEYRVNTPNDIKDKAHRSMSRLEEKISLRKQDEPHKDNEDSEDDSEDDWDDDDF